MAKRPTVAATAATAAAATGNEESRLSSSLLLVDGDDGPPPAVCRPDLFSKTGVRRRSAVPTFFLAAWCGYLATTNVLLRGRRSRGTTSFVSPPPLQPPLRTTATMETTYRRTAAKDDNEDPGRHQLKCAVHGGPSDEYAAMEMTYWSDLPGDAAYVSPFLRKDAKTTKGSPKKYLTFEKNKGGWNNIRMALETVAAMAVGMGRTLVLPPEQRMHMLEKKGKRGKNDKVKFHFDDFFHLDSIAKEHAGLEIISTKEFLEREAMTGNLRNKHTGKVSFPPGNRTDWDGAGYDDKGIWEIDYLQNWLRNVTLSPSWKPMETMLAFPSDADDDDENETQKRDLLQMRERILNEDNHDASSKPKLPQPVNAPPIDRLREVLLRRKLDVYDHAMRSAPVIHVKSDQVTGERLLVHFYAFLFFVNWQTDLWTKRFVRDHFRYRDELQCAAARLVRAVRDRARSRHPKTNPKGEYESFHVRRTDFGTFFKDVYVDDARTLIESGKDQLVPDATIYVATDDADQKFYEPLSHHYDLVFLDDFEHLLGDLNVNYYGMIDQLVASRGRTFFGTYQSTFSAYVNRLRGYRSAKDEAVGSEDGILDSYYFRPTERKRDMRRYVPVDRTWDDKTFPNPLLFFQREYPTAWRGLDDADEADEAAGRRRHADRGSAVKRSPK